MHVIRTSQDKRRPRTVTSRKAAPADLTDETPYFEPSAHAVATRAYSLYMDQGFVEGNHVQHWLDAEAQLVIEQHLRQVRR